MGLSYEVRARKVGRGLACIVPSFAAKVDLRSLFQRQYWQQSSGDVVVWTRG